MTCYLQLIRGAHVTSVCTLTCCLVVKYFLVLVSCSLIAEMIASVSSKALLLASSSAFFLLIEAPSLQAVFRVVPFPLPNEWQIVLSPYSTAFSFLNQGLGIVLYLNFQTCYIRFEFSYFCFILSY